MAKTIRYLGERNELVMMSRNLVPWLIALSLFALVGKNSTISFVAFRFSDEYVGTVTGDEETNVSANDELVWKYFYSYTVDGNTYNGYSYSTRSIPDNPLIQVSRFNPALSKIKGTDFSLWGGFGFWLLVVPIMLILLILVFRVHSLLRTRRFLIKGEFRDADLEHAEESGTVNEGAIYTLTYMVQLPDGTSAKTKQHGAKSGYPDKASALHIPGTKSLELLGALDYKPTLVSADRWSQPPVSQFLKSAIWLAAAFLLTAWAAIRITLGITGG